MELIRNLLAKRWAPLGIRTYRYGTDGWFVLFAVTVISRKPLHNNTETFGCLQKTLEPTELFTSC